MRIAIFTCVSLFALVAVQAGASTILWDESVDGTSAGRPQLTLQLGTNDLLGSSRWIGDDNDSFIFTERDWYDLQLADGQIITSISVSQYNPVWVTSGPPDQYEMSVDWTVQLPSFAIVWEDIRGLGDDTPFFSASQLPLSGPEIFTFNQAAGMAAQGSWDISWDYRVRVEVTAVPVPAASLLMIPALAVLGLVTGRNRLG